MFSDVTLEANLLAAFHDRPEYLLQYGALLHEDLFTVPQLRTFARAFIDFRDNKQVPDENTIRYWIQAHGKEWADYEAAYTHLLYGLPIMPGALPTMVDQLDELRRARQAREIVGSVAGIEQITPEEYLSQIIRAGDVARITSQAAHRPPTIPEIARRVFDEIEARMDAGGGLAGLPTGFEKLDSRMCGMRPGEITIVAARPGIGKTSLTLQIGDHTVRSGKRVLFLSLEMGADQLYVRLLSQRSGVDSSVIDAASFETNGGELSLRRVYEAAETMHESGWIIDDKGMRSAEELAAAVYARHSEAPLDLVILDYVQLVRTSRREKRYEAIGRVVLEMREAAKNLNIPVLVVSQLSRGAEEKPRLSDLRESGDLENHAALVLLLHRPGLVGKDRPPSETEAIIAKNRFGRCGKTFLEMHDGTTRFTEYERGTEDYAD